MDFARIKAVQPQSNNKSYDYLVRPGFVYGNVKDLVVRGGIFYAFWNSDHWSTSIDDLAIQLDKEVYDESKRLQEAHPDKTITQGLFTDDDSGIRKKFEGYTKLSPNSEAVFNTRIMFSDDTPTRDDYSTAQLSYTPKSGRTEAFDELVGTLYDDENRNKILWFMGAALTNSMHKIQKFMYLYGGKGTGKGTVIDIFKELFEGYYAEIDLAKLTSGSEFATSQIQELPVLVDADSDISRIKQDVNLLKLTAHEPLTVNQKYQKQYEVTFEGLLITASNQRYQVNNVDSGINRRAVVVEPNNGHLEYSRYLDAMNKIKYELPAIAQRAIDWFNQEGPARYEGEVDINMMETTDHIFAFVRENANQLGDQVSLKKAAELYKLYLEDIGFDTKGYKRKIMVELQRYYKEFVDQRKVDGVNLKNVFTGFKRNLVFPDEPTKKNPEGEVAKTPIELYSEYGLGEYKSWFDVTAGDYPAQLANNSGLPTKKWDEVTTTLKDLRSTKLLHYVNVPLNHIVIDLDLKDSEGKKDLERNLKASQEFPDTYMELSKSGEGIHMHYIYDGDPGELSPIYKDNIEIKVYSGKQSLRRKLSLCNDHKIEHIGAGLPLKERKVNDIYQETKEMIWNEQKMKTAIEKNLRKEYHPDTTSSINFIAKIFKDAEDAGVKYDLTSLRQSILVFASRSTHQAQYCIRVANGITYSTIDEEVLVEEDRESKAKKFYDDEEIFFVDIEVYPNLLLVEFKQFGKDEVTKWFNPTPEQIESLLAKPLIGFNNRRYDNHILYAALVGESNISMYHKSQSIINNTGNGCSSNAYDLAYGDIYDYSSKKQSLKKWEVELGIEHDEFEFPWDQPLDEGEWERAAEYCEHDVRATEEVFKATKEDYEARKILTVLSGMKVNSTTQQQAAGFLFGDDNRPQDKFVYTDLSTIFPGYKYEFGKSSYMGEDPSEGGYVYSEPGVYEHTAEIDISSMHPTSLIELNYFGPYTQRFANLKQARIFVKHHDFESASTMFNGVLKPFLNEETADSLAFAMKIIINIVYGLTSASFENKFKHPLNKDNIVAKRGALYMITLKHAVQEKGYKVVHIKTDSIKIANVDDEITKFIIDHGKSYGYDFEVKHIFDKMALVNKAVLIAHVEDNPEWKDQNKWEAVGAQFAMPYVFKTLFTDEEPGEKDFAITKSVKSAIYLDDTFVGKVAQVYASKTGHDMLRDNGEKRGSVTGTKGHKWKLFSEYTSKDDVDFEYYDQLCIDAIESINKVGSAVSILPQVPMRFQQFALPF